MYQNFEKYLKILELDYNANQEDIKKAYRTLVKVHHPDLYTNPENKEKAARNFKIIKTAYDYLLENYIPPEERNFNKQYNYTKSKFKTYAKDKNDALIQLLKRCIETQTRVKILYQSGYYQKITERVILPIELYLGMELNNNGFNPKYRFEKNKMYLIAFCELRHEKRTFRLDRILNIEIYNNDFNSKTYTTPETDRQTEQKTTYQTETTFTSTTKENSNSGCLMFFIIIIIIQILAFIIQIF